MKEEVFAKAKEINQKIENIKYYIDKIEKTDKIYYKTPDMDGGFTPGRYYPFDEMVAGDIKKAIIKYYEAQIDKLKQQFEDL